MTAQREPDVDTERPFAGLQLIQDTPSGAVRTALVREGYEEQVQPLRPEIAEQYFVDLTGRGSSEGEYVVPTGLPDPDKFTVEGVAVEAGAGDTLWYEIRVEGQTNAGPGRVLESEDGEYRVDPETGETYHPEDAQVVFSSETVAAGETVAGEDEERFRKTVNRLEDIY